MMVTMIQKVMWKMASTAILLNDSSELCGFMNFWNEKKCKQNFKIFLLVQLSHIEFHARVGKRVVSDSHLKQLSDEPKANHGDEALPQRLTEEVDVAVRGGVQRAAQEREGSKREYVDDGDSQHCQPQ